MRITALEDLCVAVGALVVAVASLLTAMDAHAKARAAGRAVDNNHAKGVELTEEMPEQPFPVEAPPIAEQNEPWAEEGDSDNGTEKSVDSEPVLFGRKHKALDCSPYGGRCANLSVTRVILPEFRQQCIFARGH